MLVELTVIVNGYPSKLTVTTKVVDSFILSIRHADPGDWLFLASDDGVTTIWTEASSINGLIAEGIR